MEPDTKIMLIAVCGGLLGWAIGSLLDLYISRIKLVKSKPLLWIIAVAMVLIIFWLKMSRLPEL